MHMPHTMSLIWPANELVYSSTCFVMPWNASFEDSVGTAQVYYEYSVANE